MALIDLLKRVEASAPLTLEQFDTNLQLIQDAINARVELTDTRLTNARPPTTHTHTNSDLTGLAASLALKTDLTVTNSLESRLDSAESAISAIPGMIAWHYGSGAPSNGTGKQGDFYVNTAVAGTFTIYGPKGASVWPASGVAVRGPQGLSAYEVAVAAGYPGTIAQWLQDPVDGIKGDPGTPGTPGLTFVKGHAPPSLYNTATLYGVY